MTNTYDRLYKIIVTGNNGVGKTSLCHYYINNFLYNDLQPTIGIDFHSKIVDLHNIKIKVILWDTAGQESFRSLIRSYYTNACGAIIVYDITDRNSFNDLQYWIDEYYVNKTCKNSDHLHRVMIVGNKTDLDKATEYTKRKVSYTEGLEFAQRNKAFFYEMNINDKKQVNLGFDKYIEYLKDNFIERSCGCMQTVSELNTLLKNDDEQSCFSKTTNKLFSDYCLLI